MNWRLLLTGGFARGYRTYIIAVVMIVQALASWAVGDLSTMDMLSALAELRHQLPEILTGLALISFRAGLTNEVRKLLQASPFAVMAAIALTFVLIACASVEAQTPAQRVYAAKADYAALLVAAVRYESLPRCPAPQPCSDRDAVATIRAADLDAGAALDAAEQVARGEARGNIDLALSVARAAVDALRKVLLNHGILSEA